MIQRAPRRPEIYSAKASRRPRRATPLVTLSGLIVASIVYLTWPSAPGGETPVAEPVDGAIRFLSAQEGVEYRRGDHGAWQEARSGVRLTWGDWIKSSADATAKIRFPGGATYVLPPATVGSLDELLSQHRRDPAPTQTAAVELQWVEGEDSDASSSPKRTREETDLVSGPQLVGPARGHEIDLTTQQQLRLAWEKVPDASRYALNVSASRSFASNIIEDTDRIQPSAKIGIRAEGVFYWRVAAVDREGAQGAWSEVRSFRVRG